MADSFQIPPESISSLTSSNNSFIIEEHNILANDRKPKRYNITMESDANHKLQPQTALSPTAQSSATTTISSISINNNIRKPIGKSIPIPVPINRRNGNIKLNMADSMIHNDRYNSTNSLHNFDLIGSNDYNENVFNGNTNGKNRPIRRSINILSVFVLDLFAVVLLAIMACLLRFTDQFKPASYLGPLCNSFWKNYNFSRNSTHSILFHNLSDLTFYLITFFSPLIIIILAELTRFLIQLITNSNNDERIMFNYHSAMKISIPMLVRRMLRFITGFLIGFFVASIIVDVFKLQIVSVRPYILYDNPNICNGSFNIFKNQRSFPSLVSTQSTYTGLFLILYLTAALSQRGLRGIRAILLLIIFLLSIMLSMSRVTTLQNHPIDVVVGMIIGTLIALYIVFMHLNSFTNRMSMTNFFSARPSYCQNSGGSSALVQNFDKQTMDPDDPVIWKNFRIPRAQQMRSRTADSGLSRNQSFRMSQRNRPNSYINPAFRIDADR